MKKKVKKAPKPQKELPKQEANQQKDNSFDFGGIPQRDLKKNLGC